MNIFLLFYILWCILSFVATVLSMVRDKKQITILSLATIGLLSLSGPLNLLVCYLAWAFPSIANKVIYQKK